MGLTKSPWRRSLVSKSLERWGDLLQEIISRNMRVVMQSLLCGNTSLVAHYTKHFSCNGLIFIWFQPCGWGLLNLMAACNYLRWSIQTTCKGNRQRRSSYKSMRLRRLWRSCKDLPSMLSDTSNLSQYVAETKRFWWTYLDCAKLEQWLRCSQILATVSQYWTKFKTFKTCPHQV